MRRGILAAGAGVLAALALAGSAEAHGRHMSPIKPAYDCFYNKHGWDTQGDIDITHDWDLEVYVVWKCQCEYLEQGHFACWWRNKGQYRWKEDAVRRMRELKGPKHRDAMIREIHVRWNAFHDGEGCFPHHDQRAAIVVRKRG